MTESTFNQNLSITTLPSARIRFLKRLWHLRLGILGALLISCLVIAAVFTPWLAPSDPYVQDITQRLLPPAWMQDGNSNHLLGTDHLGRDILSRIMYGTRISLVVGLSAVVLQLILGVGLGILAGYYRGRVDSTVSFIVNAMMSFPFILLALTLVSVLGPSLQNIIIALGLTGWPVYTRVTRIETIKLNEQEFILAAHSLAYSSWRIITRHILPNMLPTLLVLSTVEVARSIIRESLLSFLGLGIQAPIPSWGVMLAEGRDYMLMQWWLAAFPGLAIFMAALGINLLGDALRDLTDPHLRKN